jgi:hypothetical protein
MFGQGCQSCQVTLLNKLQQTRDQALTSLSLLHSGLHFITSILPAPPALWNAEHIPPGWGLRLVEPTPRREERPYWGESCLTCQRGNQCGKRGHIMCCWQHRRRLPYLHSGQLLGYPAVYSTAGPNRIRLSRLGKVKESSIAISSGI